jgi:hypothetical protein
MAAPSTKRTRRRRLSDVQLSYLAGLAQSNLYFQGTGTDNPVSVDKKEEWPQALAKTYGGTVEKWRQWYGWFLPIEDRLRYWRILYPDYTLGLNEFKAEKIIELLERAVERRENA